MDQFTEGAPKWSSLYLLEALPELDTEELWLDRIYTAILETRCNDALRVPAKLAMRVKQILDIELESLFPLGYSTQREIECSEGRRVPQCVILAH